MSLGGGGGGYNGYTTMGPPVGGEAMGTGKYYKVVDYYHNDDPFGTEKDKSIDKDYDKNDSYSSNLTKLRKPSQVAITDDFIKKYYWNERFQLLLEKPVTNKEEGNRRHSEISEHSQSLADNAMPIVKKIVDEVNIPFEQKTYKPIDAGGLAGGQKYIVDKMFVKFANDVYNLYGGDDNSAKAAGHELKGLSALISCNIPNLHFPLLCVINYKGYRVTVISRIPVDKSTIIYGSDDAGTTIHNKSYEIDKMLRHAAEILNLKVHKVKEGSTGEIKEVPVPIDLEGHQGTDGRYYVVDFARVLPPETPFPSGTAAYLYRMLRAEFVRQYPHALSSDAFSPFGTEDADINNTQAKEATKFLHTKAIPQLAESFPSLLERPKNGNKHLEYTDLASLKGILHKYGINLRYIGLVLHHVIKIHTAQHRASQVLAVEMASRSVRSILNAKMRKENSDNAITICVQCFNSVLGSGPQVGEFWNTTLKTQLLRQFVCHLNECAPGAVESVKKIVEQDYIALTVKEFKLPFIRRVSALAGITLSKSKLKELATVSNEYWDIAYPLGTDFVEEISMTIKHISVVPIAEVLRVEGRFLEAERFYQDEMNLRIKVLGADSLQVAVTMTHLAALYAEMASKDHLAEHYFNQALHIYEARRPDSLDLALAYERLAMFCFRRDKYKEAESLLEKVYAIKNKILGMHNEVATTLEHQAWVAHAQRKYDVAVKLFTSAVEIKKVTLSEDSLEVAKTLNNLGQTLVVLNKRDQALQLYEKVLQILKNQRGAMHSDVAVALDNLAKLYALDNKTLGKAEHYFKDALIIKREALGDDHAFTAITQDHLAQLLSRCSRYDEAEELYKKAIATLRTKLGTRHSSVGITLHNMAQMYARRKNWTKALEAEEEAARIFAYAFGESHPLTEASEAALKEIQKRSGVISRFLSKSVELPTMLHVGRIITDATDSTPLMPNRDSTALGDEKSLPADYRRLLRSAGIKQGESDPKLLAAVLEIVKEVTTASPSAPAPLSTPTTGNNAPVRTARLTKSAADVPTNDSPRSTKKKVADPRAMFAGQRRPQVGGNRISNSDPVISDPYDFQHISHVGFGKDGFEMINVPTSWKSVFSLNLSLPSFSTPASPREAGSSTPTGSSSNTSSFANFFKGGSSSDSLRKSGFFKKKEKEKEKEDKKEEKKEEKKEKKKAEESIRDVTRKSASPPELLERSSAIQSLEKPTLKADLASSLQKRSLAKSLPLESDSSDEWSDTPTRVEPSVESVTPAPRRTSMTAREREMLNKVAQKPQEQEQSKSPPGQPLSPQRGALTRQKHSSLPVQRITPPADKIARAGSTRGLASKTEATKPHVAIGSVPFAKSSASSSRVSMGASLELARPISNSARKASPVSKPAPSAPGAATSTGKAPLSQSPPKPVPTVAPTPPPGAAPPMPKSMPAPPPPSPGSAPAVPAPPRPTTLPVLSPTVAPVPIPAMGGLFSPANIPIVPLFSPATIPIQPIHEEARQRSVSAPGAPPPPPPPSTYAYSPFPTSPEPTPPPPRRRLTREDRQTMDSDFQLASPISPISPVSPISAISPPVSHTSPFQQDFNIVDGRIPVSATAHLPFMPISPPQSEPSFLTALSNELSNLSTTSTTATTSLTSPTSPSSSSTSYSPSGVLSFPRTTFADLSSDNVPTATDLTINKQSGPFTNAKSAAADGDQPVFIEDEEEEISEEAEDISEGAEDVEEEYMEKADVAVDFDDMQESSDAFSPPEERANSLQSSMEMELSPSLESSQEIYIGPYTNSLRGSIDDFVTPTFEVSKDEDDEVEGGQREGELGLPDLSSLTPTQWRNLVALVRDTSYRHRFSAAFEEEDAEA